MDFLIDSTLFVTQGLNPDHCFVATASESGEQDAREKEMEENMNEVIISKIIIISKITIIINITEMFLM